MGVTVNYEGIEKYWKDDYYFCEDKILANISNFFGSRHELMFGGGFNFGYQPSKSKQERIGDRISVRYFAERELLEKYYGIIVKKYNLAYGAESFLELSKSELKEGKPVAVGLQNCGVWQVKPGEEGVQLLPFMVIGIKDDNSVEVIDSHELGIRRVLPKRIFEESYRWGVTFEKKEVQEKIEVKEFIKSVLETYQNTVVAEHGCVDIDLSFSSISSNDDRFTCRKTEEPYTEMLALAQDILSMDFEKEVGGLDGVLWVPFYFGLLLLYRSRLVFTKALRQVEERAHTNIFQNIIKRLVVASSKWNYLRMVFTNCYHNGKMDRSTKENMSSVIREIAEHEKIIMEEFKALYDVYEDSGDIYQTLNIEAYYNTYLFDHENWRSIEERKAVYGRYFYDGDISLGNIIEGGEMKFYLGKPNEKGDSLVCLGQGIDCCIGDTYKSYQKIALCGSVLYNEMIYDYMEVLYTDGTRQAICIGFDGWIKNEYSLEETGKVIWKGAVVKRESKEAMDPRRKAVIYAKEYQLDVQKAVKEIRLPNNPFINILAISLKVNLT